MTLFVVETKARAIAAISAANLGEVRSHTQSIGFRSSARLLTSGDGPLWDGTADLVVRAPTAGERAAWARVRPSSAGDRGDDDFIQVLMPFPGRAASR